MYFTKMFVLWFRSPPAHRQIPLLLGPLACPKWWLLIANMFWRILLKVNRAKRMANREKWWRKSPRNPSILFPIRSHPHRFVYINEINFGLEICVNIYFVEWILCGILILLALLRFFFYSFLCYRRMAESPFYRWERETNSAKKIPKQCPG